MQNQKKKTADLTPAQKRAQDLKVKALEAKAKAAKSKFKSSKLRDENTPMPLAPGQPLTRMERAIDKKLGMSGKNTMDWEAAKNRNTEDFYPEIYKKNKTKSEKADSAFMTSKPMDMIGGTRKITYKEVRPSRKPSATKPKAPATKPKAPAKRK